MSDRQSYTSLYQGNHLLIVSQQLSNPQKGRTVYPAHFEGHQAVLVECHVLLLVRVQDLQHLLQHAILTVLVERLNSVAELKQLLSGWTFVEIDENGLDHLLVALFSALELHRLLVDVGLRVRSVLLHLRLVVLELRAVLHVLRLFLEVSLGLKLLGVGSWPFLGRMPQLLARVILLDALLPLQVLLRLLGLLLLELPLGELRVVLLPADFPPEIRQDLIPELVEGLLQMQRLLVDLRVDGVVELAVVPAKLNIIQNLLHKLVLALVVLPPDEVEICRLFHD